MNAHTGTALLNAAADRIKEYLLMAGFLVTKAILWFEGIRIEEINPRIPRDQGSATEFYKLRDAVFAEKYGWEEPRGLERDRFDHASIFLIVIRRGRTIAGCRIIHREFLDKGQCLPVEAYLDEESTAIITENAVEISRMINTLPKERTVFLGLHLAVYAYLRQRRFPIALATIRENYLEKVLHKKFGVEHFQKRSGIAMKKGKNVFVPIQLHFR